MMKGTVLMDNCMVVCINHRRDCFKVATSCLIQLCWWAPRLMVVLVGDPCIAKILTFTSLAGELPTS